MKKIISVCLLMLMSFTYAQNRVHSLPGWGKVSQLQYTGYVSPYQKGCTHKNCQGELGLFYWLVLNKHARKAPLILWSNGGPGSSSTFGYFFENGPYILQPNQKLKPNQNTWVNFANYLIIDHPLGTGLSFAPVNKIPQTPAEGAKQYFHALQHFYATHSMLAKRPLYLSGESYAGTTLALLAQLITNYNSKHVDKIKLHGIILVSPWIDPLVQQSKFATYYFTHGLVSYVQHIEINNLYNVCAQKILAATPTSIAANDACNNIANYIQKITHLNLTNIAIPEPDTDSNWVSYMNRKDVRVALHAPVKNRFPMWSVPINNNYAIGMQMSVRDIYQKLLQKRIPLFIFSGLDDGRATNFWGVDAFIQKLKWPGKKDYQKAKTVASLTQNGKVALGYIKTGGGLTWAKIRNAGHMVPFDQPKVALMVRYFVEHN